MKIVSCNKSETIFITGCANLKVEGKLAEGSSQEFLAAIMNEAFFKLGFEPLAPKYVNRAIQAAEATDSRWGHCRCR